MASDNEHPLPQPTPFRITIGDADLNAELEGAIKAYVQGYNPDLKFNISVLKGGDKEKKLPHRFGQGFWITFGEPGSKIHLQIEPLYFYGNEIIEDSNPVVMRGTCYANGGIFEFIFRKSGFSIERVGVDAISALENRVKSRVYDIIGEIVQNDEYRRQKADAQSTEYLRDYLRSFFGAKYEEFLLGLLTVSPYNAQWLGE